ncbi:kinase-like protein, partial [Exidia glandulosa HHB12029]
FLSELVVWSQLKHAHILPLLGSYIGTGDTRQCFVVPRMAGGTCVDYLRECETPDRLRILSEVADAVHYLHTRAPKIVHGDIRAKSVFISTAGTAFLGNFDFSPLQRPVANRFDDTDTYEIVQSMRWMAPEATRDPSTRSDVFAFGMFGFELFSGDVPFPDCRATDAARSIIRNERPPRPDTPSLTDDVWAVFRTCWRRAAPARPSMEEVSRRLRKLRAQESHTVIP